MNATHTAELMRVLGSQAKAASAAMAKAATAQKKATLRWLFCQTHQAQSMGANQRLASSTDRPQRRAQSSS